MANETLQLTNSAFLLGLVGFAQSIPSLLFSLLGGVIALMAPGVRQLH